MPKTKPALKTTRTKPPAQAPTTPAAVRKNRPARRERMNLMVDRALLARAAAVAATTNMSDVVDAALRRMAEDDAIVAGLNAAFGAVPGFPYIDT